MEAPLVKQCASSVISSVLAMPKDVKRVENFNRFVTFCDIVGLCNFPRCETYAAFFDPGASEPTSSNNLWSPGWEQVSGLTGLGVQDGIGTVVDQFVWSVWPVYGPCIVGSESVIQSDASNSFHATASCCNIVRREC